MDASLIGKTIQSLFSPADVVKVRHIMVGAVSQTVSTIVDLAQHAKSIGAEAIMVLTPPALHLSQAEIYAFYAYIAKNVDIDVMVYNNPGSAAVDIAPETMAKIVKLPHMVYLKESTGDMIRVTRMIDELSEDIITLCGCECLAYESFVMGARGWISVLANVAPKMCVALYDLIANKRDLDTARALNRKILPLLRHIEESGELWQVIKYAVHKQGLSNGILRVPRLPISDAARQTVDAIMRVKRQIGAPAFGPKEPK